jgi:histidinol dehydrogenase
MPHADERFLEDFLGERPIPNDTHGDCIQMRARLPVELGERPLVAQRSPGEEGGELRAALRLAIGNVMRVAEAALTPEQTISFEGHEVKLREVAVDRGAVYVPGGRAPYPSTVVMGVVAARVAGVKEIAVCAPPGRDGEVNAAVLGACRLAGASVVYRMGGAQAIAALAYGSETVAPVDVIVGPGNLYVQEAKRQVFGHVGIDGG